MQLAERLLHPTTFSFPGEGESKNSCKSKNFHKPEVYRQSYYEKKKEALNFKLKQKLIFEMKHWNHIFEITAIVKNKSWNGVKDINCWSTREVEVRSRGSTWKCLTCSAILKAYLILVHE